MTMKHSIIFSLLLLALVLHKAESYLAPAVLSQRRLPFYSATVKPQVVTTTSLHVTSNQFNEDDFANATSTVSESSNVHDVSSNDKDTVGGIPTEFVMQVGMVTILALVGYMVVTSLISGVMGIVFSASHAFSDEIMRELATLGSNLGGLVVSLASALWEVLKVVIPFVGKGIVDTGKAVAPVVSDASSRLSEAATPYVQEATRVVGEAASPYMQEAARAVDESIVNPMKSAVDANIMAPIQGAQTAVTSQLDTVQSSVTSQIDSTLNEVGQSVSSTIQGATDQATATVKGVVDEQTAKIVAPLQDVSGKVDASVKEAFKPIQNFFLF